MNKADRTDKEKITSLKGKDYFVDVHERICRGDRRFFLYWQIDRETAKQLYIAQSDVKRGGVIEKWLDSFEFFPSFNLRNEEKRQIVVQFHVNNIRFAVDQGMTQDKSACFIEIMHYLLTQLLSDITIDEEKSFGQFKEMLLRHAVQRPSHSLCIFNLDDVKAIDSFVQKTFFRFFGFYQYSLTVRDMLELQTVKPLQPEDIKPLAISKAKVIHPREIDDLKEYFSKDEEEQMMKEKEYYTRGLGRVELLLNEEMGRLQNSLETRIAKQDEEFLAKIPQKGKK